MRMHANTPSAKKIKCERCLHARTHAARMRVHACVHTSVDAPGIDFGEEGVVHEREEEDEFSGAELAHKVKRIFNLHTTRSKHTNKRRVVARLVSSCLFEISFV